MLLRGVATRWEWDLPPNTDAAILEESLCVVADCGEDIVPHFFDRLFRLHPEQRANFPDPDTSYGSMVNEMLESILGLANQEAWVPTSVDSFIAAHRSYADIPLALYGETLDLLIDTLKGLAGERWKPAYSAAWQRQSILLKKLITRAF